MTDTIYEALGHILTTIRDPRLLSDAQRFVQIRDQVIALRNRFADYELAGATEVPVEGLEIKNTGEFAAFWNGLDQNGREVMLGNLRHAIKESQRCFMSDHDSLKEQLTRAQQRIAELTVPEQPKAEQWLTEQKHDDCVQCEHAVELAIQDAQFKRIDSSYWNIVEPAEDVEGRLAFEIIHNGRARRA